MTLHMRGFASKKDAARNVNGGKKKEKKKIVTDSRCWKRA